MGIDNLSIDAAVKPILGVKLSPISQSSISSNLYDSFFKGIFDKKKVPDLTDLYIKRIITIDEFIEIISSLSSSRFRDWIMDKDYNPEALLKDIISTNPRITSKVLKYIRWLIPNAVGLISPATGILASLADSFIFDKISKGWHPNLFLDDFLKVRIDREIEKHTQNERIKAIKIRFPNIGRNDDCPCASKKKFKKCCGK
jgi:hypothetical protein